MAHIVLFCSSMLFVLLIGSPPCSAKKDCTYKNIKKCRADNINSSNLCRFNKRIVACLEKIGGCTEDKIANSVQSELKYYEERAALCKGLDEGDCYYAYIKRCAKDIPQNLNYRQNMSDPVIQHRCQTLKSKETEAKKCLRELLTMCKHPKSPFTVWQAMDRKVQDIETLEEYCGFREERNKWN